MKRFFALILIFAISSVFLLTSCKVKKTVSQSDLSGDLTVYYMDGDSISENAIKMFENACTNVHLNKRQFDNMDQYNSLISTETMAGKGPDLFVFYDDFTNEKGIDNFKTNLDVYRMAVNNKIFEDINPFIKTDKYYGKDDYNQNVMSSGILNGKRYFMPITFSLMQLITSKEKLEQEKINLENNYTFDDLSDAITKNIAANKNDSSKCTEMAFKGLGNDELTHILFSSGICSIDYKNNKINIDKDHLKRIVDFVKALNSEKEKMNNIARSSNGDSVDIVSHTLFLMRDDYYMYDSRFLILYINMD